MLLVMLRTMAVHLVWLVPDLGIRLELPRP